MADTPSVPASALSQGRARILVVEDEETLARLLDALLRSAGYETSCVYDGEPALEAIHTERPDLVLLDATLPKLDGWTVLARLRAERDAPPVVILSARDDAEVRALSSGAAAAVLKPFDVDDLLATIERILAKPSETRAPMP
jgi:DNA-binding response OmpR family regulator